MFFHFFTHIPMAHEEVERALSSAPSTWLPSAVEGAYETGDRIRARVGFGANFKLTKEVVVAVGDPHADAHRAVLPLRIEATGPSSLFPQLDADLEIAPVGSDMTQLTLIGSYRPPLGAAGALLDRVLLHRVVEAVAKNLTEEIARMLEERRGCGGTKKASSLAASSEQGA